MKITSYIAALLAPPSVKAAWSQRLRSCNTNDWAERVRKSNMGNVGNEASANLIKCSQRIVLLLQAFSCLLWHLISRHSLLSIAGHVTIDPFLLQQHFQHLTIWYCVYMMIGQRVAVIMSYWSCFTIKKNSRECSVVSEKQIGSGR